MTLKIQYRIDSYLYLKIYSMDIILLKTLEKSLISIHNDQYIQ